MRTLTNVFAAGALVLAACSSSPSTSPASTTSGPPATTQPATTQPSTTQPSTSTSTTSTSNPATTTTAQPIDESAQVVYLVKGQTLRVAGRYLGTWDATAVMQALLAGPTASERAAGISTQIPAGTALRSAAIEGHVATVDLSKQFESGGGSLSMQLRVAEVVYTLTTLPGVDAVNFRLDGKAVTSIGGEGIEAVKLTREALQDAVLPPILLEAPFDGAKLVQPLVIGGTTNAFEATVNYEVVDATGKVLGSGMTMATCGSGCWGVFRAQLKP
ncbi:MAG: GerMN domain-containing protein, partial [Actinomycetota bacterium]